MACYHPLTAWTSNIKGAVTVNGKPIIVFKKELGDPSTEMLLSCGKCIGCRLERSRQWAIRCFHESKLHKSNCFLTLTYSPDHEKTLKKINPSTGEIVLSLNKRDYMLFLKSFRKAVLKEYGAKIRFFQCGEYGTVCYNCGLPEFRCRCGNWKPSPGRPHHHMIIFGFDFPDRYVYAKNNGFPLYRSPFLESLWDYGFSTVADMSFESAAYVARYILKKMNGDPAEEHYSGRMPEFITMSRRPGIAREFAEQYLSSFYPKDSLTINGKKMRPPKFYDKIFDVQYPDKFSEIKENRKRYLLQHVEDNTPDRLAVKEEIQKIKAERLVRPIENGNAKDE